MPCGLFAYDQRTPAGLSADHSSKSPPNSKGCEAVAAAKKPVILAGAGVLARAGTPSAAEHSRRKRASRSVHTLLGLGVFPAEHPLFLGMARYARNVRGEHGDVRMRPPD